MKLICLFSRTVLSQSMRALSWFTYWPVAAPVNTPTRIEVNITIDPTVQLYSFDTKGTYTYVCVWVLSVDAVDASNYASAFSTFTPTSATTGTCMTPSLGTLINEDTDDLPNLQPVGPVTTTFYVIGTDGFASEVCQTTGCAENFDVFTFTPEQVNMLGTASNNWYSPGIYPSKFDGSGKVVVTVTGTGFRQTVTPTGAGANFQVTYYCSYLDQTESTIGGELQAKYVSSTMITCPTPYYTSGVSGSEPVYLDIYLQRADSCEIVCTEYRISRSNATLTYAFIYTDTTGSGAHDFAVPVILLLVVALCTFFGI